MGMGERNCACFPAFYKANVFFFEKNKKNLKNSKIYLQVDSDIVYNQYVSVFPFKKKIIGTRIRMKSKPKNQKKTNLKRILLRCGLIVFGVYAAYSFVTYQYELAQKQRELEEIKQQCVEVKLENTELERLLAQKDSTDYLEKLAREKLGYGYENEIFYVDISGN
ncbi:MAG: septum formation initiator family protein [Ruminococcaceae bacterium]|nr:septum formation initiator family protein [Oscillospiraceae bacterium]